MQLARLALVLVFLGLGACASNKTIVPPASARPSSALLNVPFYSQKAAYCGPAALRSVMAFYGTRVDQETIAGHVYAPDRKGSLTLEMAVAPRYWGFVSYPLERRFGSLLDEVASGTPVIVLQNLGLDWWPVWHYSVVTGYDLARQEMILHNGEQADYRVSMYTFINTWRRAKFWALAVTPPNRLPATATPMPYLKAVNGLEQAGKGAQALQAYRKATEKWPVHPAVLLATANSAMAEKDYPLSFRHFDMLARIDGRNPTVWNNYAYSLEEAGCHARALDAIALAYRLAPNDPNVVESYRELNAPPAEAEVFAVPTDNFFRPTEAEPPPLQVGVRARIYACPPRIPM